MFNHRISPLFSIAVLGLSLAAAGGGTYALLDNLPKIPHKEIRPEPNVITIPTVELVSPKEEPVRVEEPVQAPISHIVPRVSKRPTFPTAIAKVERSAQPCELVCEDHWNDSVLFADGSRYKNCKCK
jgi:hypothetical protein